MEYDSSHSCDDRVEDLESADVSRRVCISRERPQPCSSAVWYSTPSTSRPKPPEVSKRLLSAQVMDYYQKYSQNSSLGRYFSQAETASSSHTGNYLRLACANVEAGNGRDGYVVLSSDSSMPRERRRWARPPLIGQQSDAQTASNYATTTGVDSSRTPSPVSKRPATCTIPEERNESREASSEIRESETKTASPTSSVASHKPLEWDSGADVGYYNAEPACKDKDKKLCTIERMALARGCSAALRLDPEGTNDGTSSSRKSVKNATMRPDANSTPLPGIRASGESDSEIEITPIVKTHPVGVIMAAETQIAEVCCKAGNEENRENSRRKKNSSPSLPIKYPTEDFRSSKSRLIEGEPLKKSSSMNLLQFPSSRLSLKRSQSELNLRGREKKNLQPPLIFDSTSSIATVVNKPATRDKFIQTSLETFSQGIQVSSVDVEVRSENEKSREDKRADKAVRAEKEEKKEEDEEKKPPLPKRASSLAPKSLHSILKNSNTYDVRERSRNRENFNGDLSENSVRSRDDDEKRKRKSRPEEKIDSTTSCKTDTSFSEASRGSTSAPEAAIEDTTGAENATGRASNSFEYFPGHIYQNVAAGSTSRVSSVDTGGESRCSTMPNTSSSIDAKLWGDSDNLVNDLERSVSILKSLVDANKCDKQVKKRLIHHVMKRLATADYTDERVERDLDVNVPWNPADARNKVYRNEIIHALAQKQNTTDSSVDDWRPRKRNVRGNSTSPKKASKEMRAMKEIIGLATSPGSTVNSEKFAFDCHTNRTVMDGRKARMGLRSEDRRRETRADRDKSESSECFVPSSHAQADLFYGHGKQKEKLSRTEEAAVATTNSGTASSDDPTSERIVLVKDRGSRAPSNETDWRLPTTMSERRFEMVRRSCSESGEAKLINYAEMEKRNQLAWITNEISHLCNLKRLLEESSNKSEPNSSRNAAADSSRKKNLSSAAAHGRWTVGGESSPDNERVTSERGMKKIEEQNHWSSHGNLSRTRTERGYEERVGHTRKRNSCTQTGSDGGPREGHSRTGGEIVSATVPLLVAVTSGRSDREGTTETRDASCQTVTSSSRWNERVETSGDEKKAQSRRHVCYCRRYAVHSRHAACIVHSPARCARHEKTTLSTVRRRDERPIISQPVVAANAKSVDSRKEAKNQLNANCKSKWAIRELPVKKNRCERCDGDEVERETREVSGNGEKLDEDENFVCECSSGTEMRQRRALRTSADREKDVGEDDAGGCCGPVSEAEGEICTCDAANGSRRRTEMKKSDGEEGRIDREARKEVSDKSCKSCRTCGTVWKIREGKGADRRCECSQDYLKPVAYELKFDEGKETKERTRTTKIRSSGRGEMKNDGDEPRGLDGGEKRNRAKNGSLSRPNSARNRKCGCDEGEAVEEIEKEAGEAIEDEDGQPGTLKDFLATNKPEFVDNVETRRRYMTELSQLRQLKKEKHKQFLAMAGTSSFIKPQRSPRSSTANAQKKISEYEMKLRLRMRYLRLNEVRNKRRQREKEEDARRNHLMAKLFGQKLQQKVLKGQVDLSQSVSVISNL